MIEQKKIISFPKYYRSPRSPKSDQQLVDEINKTWRRLWRTILTARKAGLIVEELPKNGFSYPTITKRF